MEPLTKKSPDASPVKDAFVNPKPRGKKLVGKTADREDSGYLKMASFALPGDGKTYAIKALLEAGERVFCIQTDVGGSGATTIKLAARREGNAALLKNLSEFEFTSYEQVTQFLDDPSCLVIVDADDKEVPLLDWRPTVLVWEGFSNFQTVMLRDYILSLQPGTKGSSEARSEGLRAEMQDWDSIKAGTNTRLDQFLRTHHPDGTKWHKYVTFHENEPKENPLTGEMLREPMISGSARKNIAAGFDLMIHMTHSNGTDGKRVYHYEVESSRALTKKRGFLFESQKLPGDMTALWADCKKQLGLT